MEIKNIKQSQSKSRVCYFDLELEENSILLENIRLIKLENNEFYLGMITSIKSSYFNCKFINSKLEQEIAQIKEENNKIKTEKDNKELELKKKDLEKELDSLKAGNTVLIDKDSQSVTDQNPVGKDIVKEKLNQIYSNSKITTREKIRQVSNVVFK